MPTYWLTRLIERYEDNPASRRVHPGKCGTCMYPLLAFQRATPRMDDALLGISCPGRCVVCGRLAAAGFNENQHGSPARIDSDGALWSRGAVGTGSIFAGSFQYESLVELSGRCKFQRS